MAEPASCAQCGAQLVPGASACASCGRLTTTQTGSSCLGVILGAVCGLVLGTAFGLIVTVAAGVASGGGCGYHVTHPGHVGVYVPYGAILGIVGIVGAVGVLIYGIRLAQTNRARMGASLIAGAAAFLLPATPCAYIAVLTVRC
jgi:hypothetical protein